MRITFVRLLLLSLVTLFAQNAYSEENLASSNELYTGKEFKKAFSNPKDNPNLPNVLLIGDSISIGYTVHVRKLLKGKADVFRIPTNGRYSSYGLEHIDDWLRTRNWDVISFNWGLWDICYRHPESKNTGHRDKINGSLTTTPTQYKQNMTQLIHRLKATKAKLIWSATTPVPEGEVGRKVGDEIIYNDIVKQLAMKNNVVINDLHSHALLKIPAIQKKQGDVHFTSAGYKYLAKQVFEVIAPLLPKP
ncbi:SGNH/GDSL hydrolase family protein [Psychrosphaera sp. 1_MG-2023]|uniref:SGNH/GDSL hydrolase family protein n=1 Tax=Psychrosphaera sp. 1_MG-2023 TaxID=3062643 RepID=UPI0026E2B688|nr:SGNH/GDSL hydrolase family protein [Psychrosphaera sp. 1_MG-2023]MDO6719234.1 SGNH/GDSL hydrolase family protein [Psychrosphaera sp. 1_MG-2023]